MVVGPGGGRRRRRRGRSGGGAVGPGPRRAPPLRPPPGRGPQGAERGAQGGDLGGSGAMRQTGENDLQSSHRARIDSGTRRGRRPVGRAARRRGARRARQGGPDSPRAPVDRLPLPSPQGGRCRLGRRGARRPSRLGRFFQLPTNLRGGGGRGEEEGRTAGRTDERTNGTDRRMNGRTYGRTDGRTDGPTDGSTDARTGGRRGVAPSPLAFFSALLGWTTMGRSGNAASDVPVSPRAAPAASSDDIST